MKYYLNGMFYKDGEEVYEEVISLKGPFNDAIKEQLIEIFTITDDNRLRDGLALIFADLADERVVPVLIEKIKENKYSKHISTLIYACSEYDCGRWVCFFVSLVIDLDDASYIQAISVIDEMKKPIKLSDKIFCMQRLSSYLLSLEQESGKYSAVEGVLNLIDSMETVL